jgi:PAS domain S-box-containing protein
LFEFVPDAYWLTDINGTIQEANRAAGSLLNISPRFLIGKPLSVFVKPEELKNSC